MLEEIDFVRQIRANPHDVSARLIYADFLEDQGDVRGEFIRVQCQLADPDFGARDRTELLAREAELIAAHGESWLAPLRDHGALGLSNRCFERGLVERARFPAGTFLRNAEAICEIAPALSTVELRDIDAWAGELVSTGWPAQVDRLDLRSSALSLDFFRRIQACPLLQRVKSLYLDFVPLTDEMVHDLFSLDWRLTSLSVVRCRLNPLFCQRLAISGTLRSLKHLLASVNTLGPMGAKFIADATNAANLERLDLSSNGLGDGGLSDLIRSPHLRGLRELVLRGNGFKADSYRELPRAAWLPQLQAFDLRNNDPIPRALVEGIRDFKGDIAEDFAKPRLRY